jgi:hypothetical protein
MIEIILKNFAGDVALMPIRAIEFYSELEWGDPYDANVVIHNLEAESSFSITSVTRSTHLGTIKRLGYKFEATLYIPQNRLSQIDLAYIFEEVLKSRYSIALVLGTARAWTENGYEPPAAINSTSGMKISISNFAMNHSIDIESVEYRPRVVLKLFGFVKKLNDIIFL